MLIKRLVVGMLKTNCYIVVDESCSEGIIIDPGENAKLILQTVSELGISVKYIILTHSHFDHICAAKEVKEKTGAKLIVHQCENECLSFKYVVDFYPLMKRRYKEVTSDITVNGGETFTFGNLQAKIINTPGHTKGSCIIIINDCIFTGDTLLRGQCGRCDLPTGSTEDMNNSLKTIYSLDGDYKLYPGHFDESTLSYERENNPYMLEAVGL